MKYIEYADASAVGSVQMFKQSELAAVSAELPDGVKASVLPFQTMLPYIAGAYNISSSIDDYLLVPTVSLISELPNRNLVGFTNDALRSFNPTAGQLGFKTWVNKPCFVEHANTDIEKSIGFIVDCTLRPLTGYGNNRLLKVMKLLAFDRSKDDSGAVGNFANGKMNAISIGAEVAGYECSICGAAPGECGHVSLDDRSTLRVFNGKLAFFRLLGPINGFETSIVGTPAYSYSFSDIKMSLSGGGYVEE